MGKNSAGSVPAGNEGQTDMGRGSSATFPYTKGQRNTGKVATPKIVANPGTEDGNKTTSSDPRLA